MFINDQKQFDHWFKSFNPSFYVGIDTEFTRTTTFFPILCLFQISTQQETVVIDSMAVNIQSLLEKINADPIIIKIIFAGRQDVEALFHQYNILLHPIFDLQIACDFLGYKENTSLAHIVLDICHKTINKHHQKIDWSQRPLTDDMIHYAYHDSHFLIPIYKELKKKLIEQQRYEWVLEESHNILTQVMDQGYDYFKKKIFHPKAKNLALKQEFVLWREYHARFHNIPRRRVFEDKTIHEIKPTDIPWTPNISNDSYCCDQKIIPLYLKKMKKIMKIAKKHSIPKRYFYYPMDIVKLIGCPFESNILLEGWRYELLKDILHNDTSL